MSSPDASQRLVLVLGRPGDSVAHSVAARLRESFEVVSDHVESAADLRERLEQVRERLGVLVVGASDPSSASTLVWDLDRTMKWLGDRTVVVVDELTKLDAVPARLIEALTYLATDEGELDELVALVAERLDNPGEVDVLATLVRSAVARRGVDSLPPLLGDWSGVDAIEAGDALAPDQLRIAHVGDGGRSANPLWAAWTEQHHGPAIERLRGRLATHERAQARAAVAAAQAGARTQQAGRDEALARERAQANAPQMQEFTSRRAKKHEKK